MTDRVWLLWTGGWDSTFRLLQLLHDTAVRIQPLYLVDDERNSTPREIDVMREIRAAVENRWPDASGRLLPTEYGSYRATEMKPHHREQWEALKEQGRVGLQYPILSSYAEQNGIDRMELCVHKHIDDEGFSIASLVEPLVQTGDTPAGPVPVLPADVSAPEALLERFSFPLMYETKLNMKEEAQRRRWMSVMNRTWFCHDPIMGLPCGNCHPCRIAKEEGMHRRVGFVGPLLNGGRRVVRLMKRGPKGVREALARRV